MMLIMKGRITGREGRTPVLYFQHGADLIVVASCGGNDMHPAWYLNRERCPEFRTLRANSFRFSGSSMLLPEMRVRLWECVQV